MKNPVTPVGIEPATFRFVAQHINHCATAVPKITKMQFYKYEQIVVKCMCEFYYYLLIFIELYFSNFRPLTCFSVMIPEAV